MLEAEKDEYNNLKLKQIFKQGDHTSIDEIILPIEQQEKLMNYLNDLIK